MSRTEEAIRLVARMYEVRDAVRSIYGEQYQPFMEAVQASIQTIVDETKRDVLDVAKTMADAPDLKPIQRMAVIAAAVEMLEPAP